MTSRASRLVLNAIAAGEPGFADACAPEIASFVPAAETSVFGHALQWLRSDEELAKQLQDGNADALAVLFKRHARLVFGIARRILRNDAEAEDAVQQVFLDVFRSIGQFDPAKGDFKPWLLVFAYHRTFNRRRALIAGHFFDTDPLEEILPELLNRVCERTSYAVPEAHILVAQGMNGLQPRQRRTIELVYYEGLTAEEVSARTGETVRVVRHNLYRGLERLRKNLCGDSKPSSAPRGREAS